MANVFKRFFDVWGNEDEQELLSTPGATADPAAAFLMQLGMQVPEQERLLRQQAAINSLRERSQTPLRTEMVGRVAVAPHWTQAIGNFAQGLRASKEQDRVDAQATALRQQMKPYLEGLLNQQPLNTPVGSTPEPEWLWMRRRNKSL